MNTIIAEVARLDGRLEALELRQDEHEEESRLRHDASAERDAKIVEAMQAIRYDVHEIVVGKRAIVKAVKIGVAVLAFGIAGLIVTARWVFDHYVQDLQLKNDPTMQRRIIP